MTGEDITIKAADGTMGGYLAKPAAGRGPGLVVIQEIFGVNRVMRDLADGFAARGYFALAPDLFWRIRPGVQLTDKTDGEWKQAFDLMNKFDASNGVADIQATIKTLRGSDGCTGKVGAVGYCLGGQLAYLAAARTDIDASVGYYGVNIQSLLGEAHNIKKPLMLHIAAADEYTPPEAQKKIVDGLKDNPHVTLHSYPQMDHAFARVGGAHYDHANAELANGRTATFFRQHLRLSRPSPGGVATLIAIAYAAYFVADVAHEALGHGGMCLVLGGRPIFLSTTFENCSIHSRSIDGAGPVTGIAVALLAWAWLRFRPPHSENLRTFLLLTFTFAIFWNVFYLIRSGVTDQGDWAFVIAGLQPKLVWHIAMTVVGVALYALAMRMTAATIRTNLRASAGVSPFAFTLTAFATAVVLSAVAAQFDTRSVAPNLIDRLPSALAAFGLVWVGRTMTRGSPDLRIAIPQSVGWTAVGAACAVFFVAVLGPGLWF